jgi:hypothetical protein
MRSMKAQVLRNLMKLYRCCLQIPASATSWPLLTLPAEFLYGRDSELRASR